MGGVDKSDQYMAYHNVLRRTVRFWKTHFYHHIDIALVNAFILYNILHVKSDRKVISDNNFRDKLVLEIISKYGRDRRPEKRSDCRVKHEVCFSQSATRVDVSIVILSMSKLVGHKESVSTA